MSLPKPYYDEGGITIYCGDCTQILPHLPPADLVLTDPPYGIGAARRDFGGAGVKRHMTGFSAGGCVPKRDYGDSEWDDKPADQALIDSLLRISKWQIIWGGNYFTLPPARCWLVWDKLRGNTDYADAELAWTNFDRAVRVKRFRWNGFLQEHSGSAKEPRWHPTQKPLPVIEWAIQQADFSKCKTILDPFLGSGTSLVAAKMFGCSAVGIEVREDYCAIAVRRLSQSVLPFAPPPVPSTPKQIDFWPNVP